MIIEENGRHVMLLIVFIVVFITTLLGGLIKK